MKLLLSGLAASLASVAQDKKAMPSKAAPFESLPVKVNGANRGRDVLAGYTRQGFYVDLHETELAPGLMPHAPHRHENEEVMMLQTGTLEVTISGKVTKVGPGSVVYVASNEEHGWRNIGSTNANYFVMAFGRKT